MDRVNLQVFVVVAATSTEGTTGKTKKLQQGNGLWLHIQQ